MSGNPSMQGLDSSIVEIRTAENTEFITDGVLHEAPTAIEKSTENNESAFIPVESITTVNPDTLQRVQVWRMTEICLFKGFQNFRLFDKCHHEKLGLEEITEIVDLGSAFQ